MCINVLFLKLLFNYKYDTGETRCRLSSLLTLATVVFFLGIPVHLHTHLSLSHSFFYCPLFCFVELALSVHCNYLDRVSLDGLKDETFRSQFLQEHELRFGLFEILQVLIHYTFEKISETYTFSQKLHHIIMIPNV